MDAMDQNEIQEVRKIIESSTSKVSLRDLERKGFRKVKVLRSNDIDELIRRAVTAVVAREGADEHRVTEELVEQSRRELRQMMAQQQAAERERSELARENEALLATVEELRRRLSDGEAEASDLRRRLEDAEARALANEALAAKADQAAARVAALEREVGSGRAAESKLASMQAELEGVRARFKQAETGRRLLEEFEVPKLRARAAELEAEVKAAQAEVAQAKAQAVAAAATAAAAAGPPAAPPAAPDELKTMLKDLERSLSDKLARAGPGAPATDADLEAAKVSLEALFKHDVAKPIVSNIDEIKVKEQTTTSDLKSKLDRLKALRGKKGESKDA